MDPAFTRNGLTCPGFIFRKPQSGQSHLAGRPSLPIGISHLKEGGPVFDLEMLAAGAFPLLIRFLMENRTVGLLAGDMDGRIRHCNHMLAARLKLPKDAIGFCDVWSLLSESDRPRLRQRFERPDEITLDPFLLNFVTRDHLPFTLHSRLHLHAGGFLLLGEEAVSLQGPRQDELLQLNNELAVLGREHARRGKELEQALTELKASHWHLKKIQEVLPICMECGKVKTSSRWEDVLTYLKENALFLSHGYCPDCTLRLTVEWNLPSGG